MPHLPLSSPPLPPLIRGKTHRNRRQYSVRPFYYSLLILTALVAFSWVVRHFEHAATRVQLPTTPDKLIQSRGVHDELECRLVRNAKDQCAFVRANCLDYEDGLLSYLHFYYCSLADAKPIAFVILVLWLSLLFSTIGIAASDFLCIDLSTLASVLGLSESLTGVTFLAFGNGSPDVFSTFAAMKSNSGSLAVGELLGAAGFITSVVAGSMALVRPFKVARRSFVRDVGYFVVAVSFSMLMLADGRLHVWESATMVGLYCFYVFLVVTWHWYIVRQRRSYDRSVVARSHFNIPENQELDIEEFDDDDPIVASESASLLPGVSVEDFGTLEEPGVPAWRDGEEDDETRNRYLAEIRDNMHVIRPSARRRNTLNPIRPSLVGALEFQSVLSSLQRSKNVHQDGSTGLDGSLDQDNRSVASHPRIDRHTAADRPSVDSEGGTSRVRAVSANDAAGLRLDTSFFHPGETRPLLTVSRPSVGDGGSPPTTPSPQDERGTASRLTPPPSGPSSRSPSPNLLAPPDVFHQPNYQAETPQPRSPVDVSPRGTAFARGSAETQLESPSSPFPPFLNTSVPTSKAPSIRLPSASTPTEALQIHDRIFEECRSPSITSYSWRRSWSLLLRSCVPVLFPTLDGWGAKGFGGRLLGIIAAPSVFLLTITLPVVEPAQPGSDASSGPDVSPIDNNSPSPRVRLPEDSPLLLPPDSGPGSIHQPDQNGKVQSVQNRRRWDSELPPPPPPADSSPQSSREWCQWLVCTQLFTGPFFVSLIVWTATDPDLQPRNLLLPSMVALLFSLVCLFGLTASARRTRSPQPTNTVRPFLALLGFIVAISWIATIATEVVNLLKTLGVILNISDSLLGLTIFAVGNSLGDLVADITVARLGYPVMALSACFGGPMLNILLGIGLGGLYMTLNANPETVAANGGSYEIAISKVLIISGATLLITLVGLLIVVPMNKWVMDRKVGWGLVVLWCISTLSNVVAELVT
ncbi:sodium/calcium exchanger protein [Aspergillus campestris IBT 28561]|uniref:Sodium/calcium exchanger protein n=1 Tax=Aspergillus campestris (strain IBT 28561) TaxID=1392248 RepID=A0A2I1CUL1_ASPC2|nr:sodium/calcium exchanger protein [Aspergillus campestris IBT 28561]PKY01301.1 sodium/calcium exchanger protein [Aspergillus campestris IBT 28561]